MENIPVSSLVFVFALSVTLTLLLYWLVVCRELYKAGAKFPTGLKLWQMFRDLRIYREVAAPHHPTAPVHFIFLILVWFDVAMLAFVTITAFFQYTHPPLGQ